MLEPSMPDQTPFVHLRVRSPYSLLEGAIRIKETAGLCKTLGMPAAALTDTNNLFGALEFSEVLSGEGVQPIIGCTLSVLTEAPRPGERAQPTGTLVVLAQSEAGYANLMKLSSSAYLDVDATEEPHVRFQSVLQSSDGLICLTGGHDGVLNRWSVRAANRRPMTCSTNSRRPMATGSTSSSSATGAPTTSPRKPILSTAPMRAAFRLSRPTNPILRAPSFTKPMTR
jgi:DNA polymerase III alpha subunit